MGNGGAVDLVRNGKKEQFSFRLTRGGEGGSDAVDGGRGSGSQCPGERRWEPEANRGEVIVCKTLSDL